MSGTAGGRLMRVCKSDMQQGLVWVEAYLPFDPPAFAAFQALVMVHGSAAAAALADPALADRALTPIDSHGEAMLQEDVLLLAERFLHQSLQMDLQHDFIARDDVRAVQSFVNTPEIGSPHFWPGAWVVVLRVEPDSAAWALVESGAVSAVSFAGNVSKKTIVAALPEESSL